MTNTGKSSPENRNPSSVQRAKFQALRTAAHNKLLNFCQLVDQTYEAAWFHEVLADILEDALKRTVNKQKTRIIITIPPRHGKTQTTSIYFPAWILGKYPQMKFILSSYGSDLSEKVGMKTRDVINSSLYQAIFPATSLRQDSKAKSYWLTKQNGSYFAVGVGGPVTGEGANIILIDDPHKNREEAESELQREKVWEYYKSTLYSRLEGSGTVVVIMQRWHQDDLVGKLLDADEESRKNGQPTEDWELINFPAISDSEEFYKGHKTRDKGQALWEAKFPLAVLENIREVQGVYNWASQYCQDPILAASQEFKKEMFRYYEEEELEGKYLKYFTFIDPAISQKKDADNTVVLTIAKEIHGPNFYRIREDAGKFTPSQTIELIFKHYEMYRSEVYLESVAYQKSLKFSVEEQQKIRQRYFRVYETKIGNKEERIRGLLPMYERGIILHRRSDVEYERELLAFPRGKHDDRCFAAGTKIATSRGEKNIEDIRNGDKVITPYGYSVVTASGKTGVNKKVISKFGLVATPDHNIFSRKKGFASIDSISYNTEISNLSFSDLYIWKYKKLLSSMESSIDLWGRDGIIYLNQIRIKEGKVLKDCMWRFGNFILRKRFRQASIFIIKTAILSIMTLRILSAYHVNNMIRYLKRSIWSYCANIWKRSVLSQKRGTQLRKEKSFIKGSQECHINTGKSSSLNVCHADQTFQRITRKRQSIVEIDALSGPCAQDVYNLKTDDGCYYANGVLVSNCDCMSFLLFAMSNSSFGKAKQFYPHLSRLKGKGSI